jgi:hypothetical protein
MVMDAPHLAPSNLPGPVEEAPRLQQILAQRIAATELESRLNHAMMETS